MILQQLMIQTQATKKEKVAYPADHKVGMHVPEGGSDCAKCEYFDVPEVKCSNKYFVKWNGSRFIPGADPDRYCCDFFEARD